MQITVYALQAAVISFEYLVHGFLNLLIFHVITHTRFWKFENISEI